MTRFVLILLTAAAMAYAGHGAVAAFKESVVARHHAVETATCRSF
jgi:hypothetical protein